MVFFRKEWNLILVKHTQLLLVVLEYPLFTLCGLDLKVFSSLKLLWVTIDDNLTFEKHIHNIVSSNAQKTGLIRKCNKSLGNNDAVHKSFYAYILPCFEYCCHVLHLIQFAMPIRITRHTAQQDGKASVLAWYNTYHSLGFLPVILLGSGLVYLLREFQQLKKFAS